MTKQTLLQIGVGIPLLAALSASLTSCKDDLSKNEHYEAPSFLVGNAKEVLERPFEGHTFKTFLRGIELVGYLDVVDSQILTVLAPTDEAFAQYLKEKGYASIEEMYQADPDFTNQVITYHLLYYALDWEKMTNFRPGEGDGATEEDKQTMAGLFNQFRTRCVLDTTHIKFDDPSLPESVVPVVHYDRYLTVFSEKMFHTLGIDAQSNYNYFFPNTQWNPKHLANGFNVMNAAVLDTAAVVTDNGYLYHIDHVIEPVGTIYEEITKRGKYQLVQQLFDKYSYPSEELNESENRGYVVYTQKFYGLPNIANEWMSSSYLDIMDNSFFSWNTFLPTDNAVNKMFEEYWDSGCGYKDILDLDDLIQKILLEECLGYIELTDVRHTQYKCFPDYIRNGKVESLYGTIITTDPATFDDNMVCSNGILYGSTQMSLPGVFAGVAGAAMKNRRFLPYLYALDGSEMLLALSSNQGQFVALIPDTAQFAHNDPKMRLFTDLTKTPSITTLQQWDDESADYVTTSSSTMYDMVAMNTTMEVKELKSEGTQVIETNVPFNYWYVCDGKITTNALFNEQLNPSFSGQIWASFHEIPSNAAGDKWKNGRSYAYDYPGIFMPASGSDLETELSQNNDYRYPYYCFVQLLQKAGLVSNGQFVRSGSQTIRYLVGDPCRFFAIVPTNDAIKAALQTLPGCSNLKIDANTYAISGTANKTKLAAYLLSYFVTADRNTFTAYPYLGSPCKGEFVTGGSYSIRIADNGTSLTASFCPGAEEPEGNEVQLVDTYSYLPFAFSDGAFQLIDQVLK